MSDEIEREGTLRFTLEAGRLLGMKAALERLVFSTGATLRIVHHTNGWLTESFCCEVTGRESQLLRVQETIRYWDRENLT